MGKFTRNKTVMEKSRTIDSVIVNNVSEDFFDTRKCEALEEAEK